MSYRNRRRTSYFLDGRLHRKNDLLDLIIKNPGLPVMKLKGVFSMKTGNTFRKIDEYLDELQESGLIEINRSDPDNVTVSSHLTPGKSPSDYKKKEVKT